MNYRGFQIRKNLYPIPIDPNRIGFDVMDGDTVIKRNFQNETIAKSYIDRLKKVDK